MDLEFYFNLRMSLAVSCRPRTYYIPPSLLQSRVGVKTATLSVKVGRSTGEYI